MLQFSPRPDSSGFYGRFGISNPATLAAAFANGAIISSLFVKMLTAHPASPRDAVAALRAALR